MDGPLPGSSTTLPGTLAGCYEAVKHWKMVKLDCYVLLLQSAQT